MNVGTPNSAIRLSLPAETVESKRPYVLVIDDDPLVAHCFRTILDRTGFEGAAVHSAAAADKSLRNRMPDLILLEVNLPDVDGLGFLSRLKIDPHTAAIPVIICSSDTEFRVAARRLGAADFIEKPVEVPELVSRLHAVLSGERSPTEFGRGTAARSQDFHAKHQCMINKSNSINEPQLKNLEHRIPHRAITAFNSGNEIILHLRLCTGETAISRPQSIDAGMWECAQAILMDDRGYLPAPLDPFEVACHPQDNAGYRVIEIRYEEDLAALMAVCWDPTQGFELWESLARAAKAVGDQGFESLRTRHMCFYPNLSRWLAVVHTPLLLGSSNRDTLLAQLAQVERALAHAALRLAKSTGVTTRRV
jgi:DNA-binding response OmpR family regulator